MRAGKSNTIGNHKKSLFKKTDAQAYDNGREIRPDYLLLALTLGMSVFGVVMVYSASYYNGTVNYDDPFFFAKKQIVGVVLGFAAMLVVSRVDYHKIAKQRIIIFIVSVLLLIAVFIPGIGVENWGAKRWIQLPFFTVQSSEVAKFGFIIFAAYYMAKNHEKMTTFRGILPVLGAGALVALLVILEPNMSITMCVILLMLAMLFMGGARIKHFLILAIPIAALVPILIILEPYRLNRLLAFVNPWADPKGTGFQLIQSFYSLGSGGWFGLGLFNSRQKYLFLPFSESDFIFSIIGEELGLAGCILVIAVYIIIICRVAAVAIKSRDRLGAYLAGGVAAILAIQVAINLAVVTGSIPPTGLPLPLISSGSSSIIITMAAIGMVLNISRKTSFKTSAG